jgi:alpha-1,6-mannosyltransferase
MTNDSTHELPPSTTLELRAPRAHLVDTTMFWSPAGGGVARYLRDKRRWALRHAQWRHSWVVPGSCTGGDIGIDGVSIPFSGGYRFPLRRGQAARLIAQLEPDLIEAGDPYRLAWSALDAAQRCGVPAATFCHSNLAEFTRRYFGTVAAAAARAYLRKLLRNFDAVFAASRWMVDEVRGLGLDNVVHQPLGVDLQRFNPSRRDPTWRRALGLSPEAIVLLYVGRFAREKNLGVLCEMVDRLGDDYMLVAKGAGPAPPQGARVRVLPYDADPRAVATAMASADIFVHAGTMETFGLAPLESLACGTPVVLPACGGFLDLIDGRTAVGVAHATGDALAAGVRSLDLSDRAMVSEAAVEVARPYDERRTFTRLFACYAALRQAGTRVGESIGGLRVG